MVCIKSSSHELTPLLGIQTASLTPSSSGVHSACIYQHLSLVHEHCPIVLVNGLATLDLMHFIGVWLLVKRSDNVVATAW